MPDCIDPYIRYLFFWCLKIFYERLTTDEIENKNLRFYFNTNF